MNFSDVHLPLLANDDFQSHMNRVLYSVARSISGELVRAADAEKGREYFCGYCKDPLVLKKSGQIGRGSKRPHFAHKVLTPNCSPESALHFEFKTLLLEEIARRIEGEFDLTISWGCSYCYGKHTGNLLKKADSVSLEHSLGICRPDIALIDEKESIFAVIEVVVTHPPSDEVKDYYRKSGITLVELRLDSDEILNDVGRKLTEADYVQLCPERKRCSECGHFKDPVVMRVIEAKCYSCNVAMRIPFIEGDHSRGSHVGPDQFDYQEIAAARECGAIIEWQHSKTLNTRYWAATCGRCSRFIGQHLLFTEYIALATSESSKIPSIRLGDFCTYCEM